MTEKKGAFGVSVMDLILAVVFLTTLVFMGVCFYFSWYDKLLPDAMIYGYFGMITGELGVMGKIQWSKYKKSPVKRTKKK